MFNEKHPIRIAGMRLLVLTPCRCCIPEMGLPKCGFGSLFGGLRGLLVRKQLYITLSFLNICGASSPLVVWLTPKNIRMLPPLAFATLSLCIHRSKTDVFIVSIFIHCVATGLNPASIRDISESAN